MKRNPRYGVCIGCRPNVKMNVLLFESADALYSTRNTKSLYTYYIFLIILKDNVYDLLQYSLQSLYTCSSNLDATWQHRIVYTFL